MKFNQLRLTRRFLIFVFIVGVGCFCVVGLSSMVASGYGSQPIVGKVAQDPAEYTVRAIKTMQMETFQARTTASGDAYLTVRARPLAATPVPTVVRTGILNRMPPPEVDTNKVLVQNIWQNLVNDKFVIVVAGGLRADQNQGAFYVLSTPANDLNNINKMTSQLYLTPTKKGWVEIIQVQGAQVSLSAKDRTRFVFDLTSQNFKKSSANNG